MLHFNFVQDDAQYFWASSEAGSKQRKTSWKMSKGSLPRAEEGESKPGARYTEAEWQQMVMGLKRENKESIEKLRKEQDEALFKVRSPLSQSIPDCFFCFLFPSSSFQIVQDLVLLRVSVSLTMQLTHPKYLINLK